MKKKIKEIPALRQELHDNGIKNNLSENFIKYIWEEVYTPQLGYGFSLPHTVSYSIIAVQELNLAYKYPIIYWNCASLCIDAGESEDSTEEVKEEIKEDLIIDNIDNGTDEVEELFLNKEKEKKEEKKKKKTRTTDYAKIAAALNDMITRGVKIVPPNINKSKFDFRPDAKENTIIYGFKGIEKIGDSLIKDIILNQPFESIKDFTDRIKCNRTQLINLIKAGCFDNLTNIPKRILLYNYVASISEIKDNLNLSSVPLLLSKQLIDTQKYSKEIEFYLFNKQLRSKQNKDNKEILTLDHDDIQYVKNYDININKDENSNMNYIEEKKWKKLYMDIMKNVKEYIIFNKEKLLMKINDDIIKENLIKYAVGTESEWEMKSISFYYSGHELGNIKNYLYDIKNFRDLPEEPEVEFFTKWKGKPFPILKLNTIAGTVIGKNKTRHTIAILTTTGVVNVKIYAELFSYLDKQISMKLENGKKKVMEKSWFCRGNKLLITGIRRGDQFLPKIYKHTPIKQIYLITKVNKDGTLLLQEDRFNPDQYVLGD